MGYGLFGKLPQRRDFVSHGLPSPVLLPWETWLQSGMGASRAELLHEWEHYYLVAPIWRYWIGGSIFGHNYAGILMASVDQVGRYFPLTLSYVATGDETLAPPTLGDSEDWYATLDARLLSVLADGASIDPASLIADLPAPPLMDAPAPFAGPLPLLVAGGDAAAPTDNATLIRDYTHAVSGRSYWWMNATPAAPAQLIGFNGMAHPAFFARLLQYPPRPAEPA